MSSIRDLYRDSKPVFSCEIYPPKKEEELLRIDETLTAIGKIHPDFLSVTYGAGGSNAGKAVEIASFAKNKCGLEVLSHITSVGFSRERLHEGLLTFREHGIENVLVLRGDRPKLMTDEEFNARDFLHASDMAEYVQKNFPEFTIAGACYPDKHFEAKSLDEDADHLKLKVESGCSMLISQLFLDNSLFYSLLERMDKRGIHVPVSAGIMPITSVKMLGTTISLSGTSVPKEFSDLAARYADRPEDMKKAGIDYAIRQCQYLLEHGADGIHLYIMNKPALAEEIFSQIRPRYTGSRY
ncbi:MAG: methylenetetrahydrofolate reductase [Lachnospiraceae bacterium]|nr:methylenetetrahydrofolate reductase [Lachnospiraceae bacterium]